MELEKFSGVVVFTTNLISNYDEAFKRRILLSVYFDMPDEKARLQIWKLHLSDKMPLADDVTAEKEAVDIEFRYNINGILEVNVKVVSTGKITSKEFNMYNYDAPKSKAESNMEELEWENYSLAGEIKTTVMLYQNRRNGLPEEAKQKADALMKQLKQAVTENDAQKVEKIDDALTALLFEF